MESELDEHKLSFKTVPEILDYIDGCVKQPGGILFKSQRSVVEEYIELVIAAQRDSAVREALDMLQRSAESLLSFYVTPGDKDYLIEQLFGSPLQEKK